MTKMDCSLVQESLSAYVSGESSPIEKQVISTHLENCYHCQEVEKDLRSTWDLLGEWTTPAPHPLAVHRFRKAFRETRKDPLRESIPTYERILKRHSFWVRGWQALSIPVFALAIVLVFVGIIGVDPAPSLDTLRSPTYVGSTANASSVSTEKAVKPSIKDVPKLYEEARKGDKGLFTVVNYENPSGAVTRTAGANPHRETRYY